MYVGGSRVVAPLILKLHHSWRSPVNITPRKICPPETTPVVTELEVRRGQESVWTCWRRKKLSCPCLESKPEASTRQLSLYTDNGQRLTFYKICRQVLEF